MIAPGQPVKNAYKEEVDQLLLLLMASMIYILISSTPN